MMTVDEWNKAYQSTSRYTKIPSSLLDSLLSYAQHDGSARALDIGCGTGYLVRDLENRGYRTLGVDFSAAAIELAQSRTPRTGNSRYLVRDIEQDDLGAFPYRPYNVVTCMLVYQFIHDKPAFLARISNLLAPGGIFIASIWREHISMPQPFDPSPLTDAFDYLTSCEDRLYYFVGRRRTED